MFFSLIEKRRSIRKFKDIPVEKENVNKLIEAALRPMSGRSRNPWRFIVVDQPDLIQKLAGARPSGSTFLKNAPLAFVILADPEKTDVWVEDAAIATTFLHLAATDLGLGSCWIQVRRRDHDETTTAEEYIRSLLNIPSNFKVESMLAVGHADEEKSPHAKESLQLEKVTFNTFS
ncbi:Nitroreductase [Desulfocicer vacuolatum DSM 3385]|uniref:Nitroreductase n=1 Tax=Desulfocicer vacuolatum DSM 3385 TaxID=1121400 RepID=A0A1W2BRR7_9BACT|nr:nitroreductase family protein [Desulfocicer vacuolatum]SMC75677.1 Nitroreductase [Desulfocicer vacuolatum DSM 3385]